MSTHRNLLSKEGIDSLRNKSFMDLCSDNGTAPPKDGPIQGKTATDDTGCPNLAVGYPQNTRL